VEFLIHKYLWELMQEIKHGFLNFEIILFIILKLINFIIIGKEELFKDY